MQEKQALTLARKCLFSFSVVVRPAGFEPTTPWFVAKYSIQLSYGRKQSANYIQLIRPMRAHANAQRVRARRRGFTWPHAALRERQ